MQLTLAQAAVPRPRIRTRTRARTAYWDEYDRASARCVDCNSGKPLEIHHADGNPFNNELGNLVALCHGCHRARHRRESIEGRLNGMRDEFDAVANGDESAFDSEPGNTGYGSAH